MPRANVVTQAYGSDVFRAQALYLAWSTLAWQDPGAPLVQVHVYTDRPEAFRPLEGRLELRVISAAELERWWGPHRFVYRSKPAMLQEMAERFPGDPLLFLDADTFWQRSPARVLDRIGPGRAVMHAREEHLADRSDPHMRNFHRHLRRLRFRGAPVDVDRWMWNSGAIGLHPRDFGVIEDWIAFLDEIVPRYRRSIVEQYALAMLLQQRGELTRCDDHLFHYWFQKDEYNAEILRELEVLRGLPPDEALARVREQPVHVTFHERRRRRTPFLARMRRSLLGER